MATANSAARGTLYVVATPIGNLEDITLRALRVLKEADLIACEDTRQTQKLLTHFAIAKPTVSYHEHNEAERAAELVERLEAGKTIALVSDAGMPGISDPGYRVVALAVERGLKVVPIPGAVAFATALAASGLPTDSFHFNGFLPAKSGQRRESLETIGSSTITEIFYEAPHRLLESLRDAVAVLGAERPLVVARELTKVHEEFVRGGAAQVLAEFEKRPGEVKGEIVLLVGKGSAPVAAKVSARARLDAIMREQKLDEKAALKVLAREMGVSKSEVYREVQRGRKSQDAGGRT
jgi:16S rRNA (cytidine1402-2'-O)-methyltransferase